MDRLFALVDGKKKKVDGTILLTIYIRRARSARKILVDGSGWFDFLLWWMVGVSGFK